MPKNLRHQAKNAVRVSFSPGMDKHAMKVKSENGNLSLPETHHIFSVSQRKVLMETASQAMNYVQEHHPDIKWVRDVKVEHLNEFLATKTDCTTASISDYASRIRKLERCINHCYGLKLDWHTGLIVPKSVKTPKDERVRTQQMEREDYEKILDYATKPGKTSLAPTAWELSARYGLRVEGASKIRVSNVHLERPGKWGFGQIDIVEKGKRHRDIDIMSADDRNYIAALIDGKSPNNLLVGVGKDAINKALNRTMKALNLKEKYPETGEHSLRKLYAQTCWDHCRKAGMTKKEAIRYVNQQLGHGQDRDSRLLALYVRNMH